MVVFSFLLLYSLRLLKTDMATTLPAVSLGLALVLFYNENTFLNLAIFQLVYLVQGIALTSTITSHAD